MTGLPWSELCDHEPLIHDSCDHGVVHKNSAVSVATADRNLRRDDLTARSNEGTLLTLYLSCFLRRRCAAAAAALLAGLRVPAGRHPQPVAVRHQGRPTVRTAVFYAQNTTLNYDAACCDMSCRSPHIVASRLFGCVQLFACVQQLG